MRRATLQAEKQSLKAAAEPAGAFRRGAFIALPILIAAIAWSSYVHWTAPVIPYDDAYITYRYVDNLTSGEGLVYNTGQRVFGSSTPLYLLILVVLKMVFSSVPIPELAVRFNLISYACSGIAVYLLLRRFTARPWFAALAAAAIMLEPELLATSLGGMESFLFLGLLLMAVLAGVSKRPLALGVLTGLTCLTRPEGMLLIPIIIAIQFRSKKDLLLSAAALLVTVLPWVLFAWMYYGSPIPLSLVAKSKPLYPLLPGTALSHYIYRSEEWFFAGFLGGLHQLRSLLMLNTLLIATVASLVYEPYRKRNAWIPGMLFWGYMLLYGVGNPLIFDWYWPLVLLSGGLVLLTGLPASGYLLERLLKRNERPALARWAVPASFILGLGIIAFVCLGGYGRSKSPTSIITDDPVRIRIFAYRKAAEKLNAIASPDETIATPEIGTLGFYSKSRILDSCGLVSPEALEFIPVPKEQRVNRTAGAISTDFVMHTKPDYVVTMPFFALRSLLPSKWFASNYDLIDEIPLQKTCWGSKEVLIFKKKASKKSGQTIKTEE